MNYKNSPTTSWDNFADWYDKVISDPNSYQQKLILPNILRMLNIKGGDSVLDIACGTGFFTEKLAELAKIAVGIDNSSNLIKLAIKKHKLPNTIFFVADAERLSVLKKNPHWPSIKFDVATLIMAIENIADAKKSLEQASQLLSPDGRLLIVMSHPAFRIPQFSSWGWDEKTKKIYRRIDSYLSGIAITCDL